MFTFEYSDVICSILLTWFLVFSPISGLCCAIKLMWLFVLLLVMISLWFPLVVAYMCCLCKSCIATHWLYIQVSTRLLTCFLLMYGSNVSMIQWLSIFMNVMYVYTLTIRYKGLLVSCSLCLFLQLSFWITISTFVTGLPQTAGSSAIVTIVDWLTK